jgi:lipopolysaccharide export system protein LptC
LSTEQKALHAARNSARAGLAYKVILAALTAGGIYLAVSALLPMLWQGPVDVTFNVPEMPKQAVSYNSDIKGTDKQQKPFHITATRGYQDAADKNVVHLETFNGTFRKESGTDVQVTSKTGLYNSDDKVLDLSGDVVIADGTRFTARMDKATFDVHTRALTSQSPVDVLSGNSHITADSMVAENNGERMVFKGKVKARFNGGHE